MSHKASHESLLNWYDRHRRSLPWRATNDPFAIWVSEVMLQQTQVRTVIPYYKRFLKAFPNALTLAQATQQEVLKLWEGLGYYARARNLHKAAVHIVANCGGVFPETVDELLYATNQRRRQKHGLASQWIKEGNKARLKIEECGCTLVRAGLAKPNPVHCLCSAGLMESIFSPVWRGAVSVEVVQAIGFGDDVCEFCISFIE